jgi:hypothetical protein
VSNPQGDGVPVQLTMNQATLVRAILDGVRTGAWRILIGQDAMIIDAAVRAKPEAAYDYADLFRAAADGPASGTS